MNDKQRAQACLAALVLIPLLTWFFTGKIVYGIEPHNARPMLAWMVRNTFAQWPLIVALVAGLILAIVVCVLIVKFGKMTFAGAHFDKYFRGSQLVSQSKLKRLTKERQPQITIAGVPVPTAAETTHFSIGGATGTGKSTVFREMMLGCMRRKDRMVVLDPDGEFLSTFYRKGDKILNPYDKRTEGWSFYNEIRDNFDFERYAKSIIQVSSSNDSEEWNGYGRLLFAEVARKLYRTTRMPSMRDVFQWTNECSVDSLEAFVRGTRAVSLFTENEKATGSVRFVLSNKLPAHFDMPPGAFSLRKWCEDPSEGNLFITWDENMREALRPLISCWVDTIFTSLLGMQSNPKRRIWTFLDELESLQRLPTLGDILTRGRKKGACVVSGWQSYTQVEDVYGVKLAETMLANHRTMLALAVGRMGTDSAERMSRALSEHEVLRTKEGRSSSWSNWGTRNETEDVKPERIVMASEIMGLNNLEGFLAFPGSLPIARVKIDPINFTRSTPVPGIVPMTAEI
ncbi:TPA: type IV secretion system DNA-binding domain-containing protein [Pseudomonas aeruginosa]|uniref:type IV secretion system DNA-binding domain-containing protein n=1 Tax=Pseudomonas aeruginosa TaxID=287 RepID=UPI0020768005|nr:type IV secretion system DNA-binding domain-containing protein [Pseudomonas aeruginosa]MCM8577365.1 type IV secretion system DNA-binding domain-containing protein [Pseudomonas aeruginosa]HCF4324176.1 type IV secretion system DNA-binding domain-containing protein [Pseudomonas aeruginosa]HDQ4754608.1 type IV secretion system DNA-binding domain-containing protein [Pseudomonas aeruginosa]HEJ4164825.1 type IV secretion system DNA-binding domain-containing protein [Pseudomonas aeruginosa]